MKNYYSGFVALDIKPIFNIYAHSSWNYGVEIFVLLYF